ncbi:MAG: hypothetical protein L6R37_004121 [Teloschistes peruensis]|nr:MAG: hypothetical protein L6R37_004121 [Teloschistes peruensis]
MDEPSHIYKILPSTHSLPTPLQDSDVLPKTSLDVESGFIHFSTRDQVPYVLNRFFSSPEASKVWLIKIHYTRLAERGNIKWEAAGQDGSLFAHLYDQEVTGHAVDDVKSIEQREGKWASILRSLTEDEWL